MSHQGLRVRTDVEDAALEIDTAVLCGLIINEVVSNAMKHAFPARDDGELVITLHRLGERRHRLTAYPDPQTLARARITEPYGYVGKPFSERELHANIEMGLYKHRSRNLPPPVGAMVR